MGHRGGESHCSRQRHCGKAATGRYFIWTANLGGDRLDAFLVKVPAELLDAIIVDPEPPVPLSVGGIQPDVVAQGAGIVTFIVTGTGFAQGITLAFQGGDGPAPRDRLWDVRATNPDGSTGVGAALLRITP